MKNKDLLKYKKLTIGFFIFLISVFLYMLLFYTGKQGYLKKLEKLNHCVSTFNCYTTVYDDYFTENFCYPENMDEIENFRDKVKDPLYHFDDPFSKHNGNLLYIPLYNKNNKLPEGYVLLSAGIDGEINTMVEDTVFLDDSGNIYEFADNFNLYNYFFGKKDLLIEFKDGVESFISNAVKMGIYSPADFYIKYSSLLKSNRVSLSCAIKGKLLENKEKYIVISDNEFSVYCKMYKGQSNSGLLTGKIVTIVGRCNEMIDINAKTIYLTNCIVLKQ